MQFHLLENLYKNQGKLGIELKSSKSSETLNLELEQSLTQSITQPKLNFNVPELFNKLSLIAYLNKPPMAQW